MTKAEYYDSRDKKFNEDVYSWFEHYNLTAPIPGSVSKEELSEYIKGWRSEYQDTEWPNGYLLGKHIDFYMQMPGTPQVPIHFTGGDYDVHIYPGSEY